MNVPGIIVFKQIKIAKSERVSLCYDSASSFSSYTNFKSAKLLIFSYISTIENCILFYETGDRERIGVSNAKVTVPYGGY